MKRFRFSTRLVLAACCTWLLAGSCFNRALIKTSDPELAGISLPRGFRIALFATGLEGPRSMALGDQGTLFVGSRAPGKVYALRDLDGDYRADTVLLLADKLSMPNGVAFRQGSLYVAEVDKVWRYDQIESRLSDPPAPVLITDDLPDNRWHGWKYLAFGPDDKLYVPVGMPCNVCERDSLPYGTILRMNPDGSDRVVYARGVRNSVGFDWHPATGELWFTDNGRDLMGDDLPPDELNRAPAAGLHFGFPYCHGGDIPDPRFGEGRACADYVPPVQRLNPHTAALGMKFYTGRQFPAAYRGSVFIAEHGSWNRKEPTGYRITRVTLDGDRAVAYEPFAEGWLRDGKAWGRPVDLLQLPDGSLLVSDDHSGSIYRISYD
ncbi:MAG: sorbosone dehydrogenase family protein [Bacteroidia bacterium]